MLTTTTNKKFSKIKKYVDYFIAHTVNTTNKFKI